jgi:hypothetical protein
MPPNKKANKAEGPTYSKMEPTHISEYSPRCRKKPRQVKQMGESKELLLREKEQYS